MEDIDIWAIENAEVVPLERAQMDLESDLEDTLVAHPEYATTKTQTSRSPNAYWGWDS